MPCGKYIIISRYALPGHRRVVGFHVAEPQALIGEISLCEKPLPEEWVGESVVSAKGIDDPVIDKL